MSYQFCVVLHIETDDPRLTEEALTEAVHSGQASKFAGLRRAVLQHLPTDVRRLVAIMPVEDAMRLMLLQETIDSETQGEDGAFGRPPPGYVPPSRE